MKTCGYNLPDTRLQILLSHFARLREPFSELRKTNKQEQQKYEFKNLSKVVSATFLLVCFLNLNESTCQTRENAFYFTSKALFVLEKIKF